MKITIQNTARIVEAGGVECRVWEGQKGIKVQCLIARVAAAAGEDLSQFEAELKEQAIPSAIVQAFPLKMIL